MSDIYVNVILNNKYELIRRVGIGGMAFVYKARVIDTDEIVAVKILKDEYCYDTDFIKSFNNEAKASAGLNHPNIVSVYDVGQDGDVHYLVREYIDGIQLKDYIDALQSVSWQDGLNIAAQILSAVQYAHEHHIVHRDIKPMNIIIAAGGVVKLSDFGIARIISNSTTIQAKNEAVGSVHYLSPEQARGGYVDARSDIYSIGITLYEIIIGAVPFDGETHVSIALKHIDGKIIPPHEVDADIPMGLNDLIVKATRKDPNSRFQSAAEMLEMLNEVVKHPYESFLEKEKIITPVKLPDNSDEISQDENNETQDDETYNEEISDTKQNYSKIKIVSMLVYTTAIAICIVMCIFVADIFNRTIKNMNNLAYDTFVIYDYTGMQIETVQKQFAEVGLVPTVVLEENTTYPGGYILKQSLPATTVIDSKDKIILTVSAGEDVFLVKDYYGYNYETAKSELENLGMTVLSKQISDTSVEIGNVVRTDPVAGVVIKKGDTITVYRSSSIIQLKNYTDLDYRTVEHELNTLGIITEIRNGISNSVANQNVIRTVPAFGQNVFPGEKVIIYKSSGSLSVVVPDLVGMTHDQASSKLHELGLSLGYEMPNPGEDITDTLKLINPNLVLENGQRITASDVVVEQYPEVGTMLFKGEDVRLFYYEKEKLREYKEYTFKYPYEKIMEDSFTLRIEATLSDSGNKVVIENRVMNRSEFYVKYEVPLGFDGYTVVDVYITGSDNVEILYEKFYVSNVE